MFKKHDLKIAPDYFQEIWEGNKFFEIRINDRDYKKGDEVTLHEIGAFNTITAKITFITDYQQKDNYVVFGIKIVRKHLELSVI